MEVAINMRLALDAVFINRRLDCKGVNVIIL